MQQGLNSIAHAFTVQWAIVGNSHYYVKLVVIRLSCLLQREGVILVA